MVETRNNYRIRSFLVLLNDQHFLKFMRRGLDNGDFFQKFSKFYNCLQLFTKSATGGLFYYYGIVFK